MITRNLAAVWTLLALFTHTAHAQPCPASDHIIDYLVHIAFGDMNTHADADNDIQPLVFSEINDQKRTYNFLKNDSNEWIYVISDRRHEPPRVETHVLTPEKYRAFIRKYMHLGRKNNYLSANTKDFSFSAPAHAKLYHYQNHPKTNPAAQSKAVVFIRDGASVQSQTAFICPQNRHNYETVFPSHNPFALTALINKTLEQHQQGEMTLQSVAQHDRHLSASTWIRYRIDESTGEITAYSYLGDKLSAPLDLYRYHPFRN